MSIGKIFFFLLMPIVYKLLEAIFEEDYIENMNSKKLIFEIFQLLIYYAIEFIYIIIHYFITNEWLFMKNRNYSDSFPFFVLCALFFIIFSICCLITSYDIITYHITKLLVLLILYTIFIFISNIFVSYDVEIKKFENMPYEKINEEIIYLKAFSDTTSVSGKINGGIFYISGKIQENYELYYSFIDSDGSLVIRHFTYNEENCKIFLEENCTQPRIEIITYAKKYEENYSSYCNYVVYIPDSSIIGYELDLQ